MTPLVIFSISILPTNQLVAMETTSAVIKTSTNYRLQVNNQCYEYSYLYKHKASSLELRALKALAHRMVHHFREA